MSTTTETSWTQTLREWVNVHPALASLAAVFLVMAFSGGFIVLSHHDDGIKIGIEAHAKIDSQPTTPVTAPKPEEPKVVYDPPASKQAYKTFVIEGEISTVEYNGNKAWKSVPDDKDPYPKHYMPDFTRVKYAPDCDDCQYETYDFCGNLIDYFVPGHKLKIMIRESYFGDYNGCYVLPGHEQPFTFGGKPLTKDMKPEKHITVPEDRKDDDE